MKSCLFSCRADNYAVSRRRADADKKKMGAFLSLVVPLVIPLGLTLWWGTTRLRVLGLLAFGPVAIGIWFVVGLLNAPTRVEDANCHHCGEYFGRWLDPVNFLFLRLWVALWLVGVGAAVAIRYARGNRAGDSFAQVLVVVIGFAVGIALLVRSAL